MSFFDEEDTPPRPLASSSRGESVSASSSTSFLDRLRSTASASPAPHPPPGQRQRRGESYRSESVDDGHHFDLDLNHEHEHDHDHGSEGIGSSTLDLDLNADEEELDDVRKLVRCWVKERGTVDISQWEGELMDTILDKLEQQQKMVATLRSDPLTSEEEHFKLMLVQTEMERVKYLVRSYVRTRLHKIEKYSHYITVTPSIHHLLSGAELSHAQRYTDLLHTHFQHSVLDSLPEWLRKMDDTYGDGLSMITKPNRNNPVLIYCRKDCGEITLEGGERAALGRGTTHLVKYRLVERWINLGWAEVL